MILREAIRDNRATVIAAVLTAALVAGLFLAFGAPKDSDTSLVALVHDGDGRVHELPLAEDATLTVTTKLGTNTIVVEGGAVRMAESDCPNRTCLQVAPLTAPGAQIICLPHQLWIEVAPEGSDGTKMDVTLAEDLDDGIDLQAR